MNKFKGYLEKKGVTLSPKLYFVDAMSAMALGLFASLLMGTIFGTVLKYIPEGNAIYDFFKLLSGAGGATGAMIGVAIAYALKAPMLVMLSAGVVGMFGNAYGSNIYNIAVILGVVALIRPIMTHTFTVLTSAVLLVSVSLISGFLVWHGGGFSRLDAFISLAAFAVLLPVSCHLERKNGSNTQQDAVDVR